MASYTVERDGREGSEPFSNYLYYVVRDGERVAELLHTYRGDEHWIRSPGGAWQALSERILLGGGPEPLDLTPAGVRAIEELTASGAKVR